MTKQAVGRGVMGITILVAAAALVIAILLGSRPAMTALMPHLGAATQQNAPLMETLFNLLVFGTILIVALIGGAIDGRNAVGFGPKAAVRFPLGLAIGLAGVSLSTLYAWLAGTLVAGTGGAATPTLIAWGAAVVFLQTLAEEAYFRGWLQPALRARWGLLPALIATALAFAGLHLAGGARAPVSLVNLLLGGIVFGLLAQRGGGLATAIGAHFAWNGVEELVYGLDPNPGAGSFGAVHDWDLAGREIWGGSGEGLNASIGMTFALLAILVPLLILSWGSLFGRERSRPAAVAAVPA